MNTPATTIEGALDWMDAVIGTYRHEVRAAVPGPAVGAAVDPIALEPVDEVLVTTLVDNVYRRFRV